MIPKIIHYCWFGGNPKPELAQKCIKSWGKYCNDYQLMEWNEESFSIDEAPLYVRQAYAAKKWAFVTDYVRLWAMTTYGGIYMDTDVEVVKRLDKFLKHRAFSGFESDTRMPTGIMACEKGFPLFEQFLRYYDTASFLNDDGTYNVTTNVTTITNACLERGLILNNTFQEIEGFAIYPKEYFCPITWETGRKKLSWKTATIHWFAGSWHTEEEKKKIEEMRRQEKREFWRHFPERAACAIIGEETFYKLKDVLKI